MKLEKLAIGEKGYIARVNGETTETEEKETKQNHRQSLVARLNDLGFVRGNEIEILEKNKSTYLIKIKNSRYAIDKYVVSKIEICSDPIEDDKKYRKQKWILHKSVCRYY